MRQLFLLLAALLSTDAFAAPGWTDPSPLPFEPTNPPVTGYADGGVQITAHVEVEGTVDDVHTRLIVTRHAVGETEVEELRIESTPTAVPAQLDLAVAPSGAAVIVFAERSSNDLSPLAPLRWRAIYRSTDGTWDAPVTLFTDLVAIQPGLLSGEALYCAIAPDGTAVAGAGHIEPDDEPSEPAPGQTDARLDLAVRPAGGSWQAPQRLTAANVSIEDGALRVDASGNFLMVWASRRTEGASDDSGDDKLTILTRKLLAGTTTWTAADDVTSSNDEVTFNRDAVAVGASGRAVIGFQDGLEALAVARDDATTAFGSPVTLVTTGSVSFCVAAGVAADDTAYVIYSQLVSSYVVGMVKRTPGGSWTDEFPVSTQFRVRDARIAFTGDDAIAIWGGKTDGDQLLLQRLRWPAGAGVPESFEQMDERPGTITVESFQSDRAGSLVAEWHSSDGRVRAVYDAGAPILTASTVPASVVVGTSADFAATFVDIWSDLGGPTAWSFGDGSADASGASVSHAFAVPGAYTVSATSADVFGNALTSTFPVTVTACESQPGVDGVTCRCTGGLASGIAACDGAAIHTSVSKKFDVACGAIAAARGATSPKKGKKSAAKAAKSFKKAAAALKGKKSKSLPSACRDALATVLGTAKDRATALKGSL